MRPSKLRVTFNFVTALVLLVGLMLPVPGAQSAPLPSECPGGYTIIDRPLCVEYDTGIAATEGAPVLYQGIRASSAVQFLSIMWDYLTNPAPDPCVNPECLAHPGTDWGLWTRGSASNIINLTLGIPGASLGSVANSITYATNHFAEYSALVTSLDAAGRIHWDELSAPVWSADPTIHSSANPNTGDVYFFMGNLNSTQVTTFYNADMSVAFRIERDCGNFIAFNNPANNTIPFTVTLNAGPGGNVNPGDTVTLPVSLTNNSGSQSSLNGTLVAYNNGGVRVTAPCAGSCTPGGTSDLNSGISVGANHGYNTVAPVVGGRSGPGWYWNTSPLGPSMVSSGNVQFTIPLAAPAGGFTIEACFSPTDLLGSFSCVSVNYNVVATPRYPGISAQNGDVYAGGGVCGAALAAGSPVTGNLNANSYGDYVVAASGNIAHFSSSHGTNTLNLGSSGQYAMMCRPNLLEVAGGYTGPRGPDIAGSSFSVSGKSGVFYYNGAGPLQLSGVISGNITIVVPNGSVLINGAIQTDGGGFGARALPGLGIISRGDIQISAGVTRVDAYLFSAQGRIDTCIDHSAACANQLTVNGFLMAQRMSFSRLGASGAGAVIAEIVVLSPQIYLNPPPLFSSSVAAISLDGEGEKQPLF